MTIARVPRLVRLLPACALALAMAGCGKYSQVGQKLDVTTPIPAGETWIAPTATGRTMLVLLIGAPSGGASRFSFTAVDTFTTSGTALQGTWVEGLVSTAATTLQVEHTYLLHDESQTSPLSRQGATRDDTPRTVVVAVDRSTPGRLVVTGSGSAGLDGIYFPFLERLATFGGTGERAAACAYQVSSLAIQSSEIRTIGFGGSGMLQYQQAEDYIGTMAGRVNVSMVGYSPNTVTNRFFGYQDFGGVVVDGPQTTHSDSSGNGWMEGTATLTFTPTGASTIIATLVYGNGSQDDPNALKISGGNTSGGHYTTRIIAPGPDPSVLGTSYLDPTHMPTTVNTVADCLGF
jgi:hypothetical protein